MRVLRGKKPETILYGETQMVLKAESKIEKIILNCRVHERDLRKYTSHIGKRARRVA